MGEKRETHLIATCASLVKWAESGSREVDELLAEGGYADFSQLRPLAGSLRQLCDEAHRLKRGLDSPAAMSSRLRAILSAHLVECDEASSVMTKQLMRLTPDTPTEVINMATVLQYESFLNATAKLLALLSRNLQQ